MILFLDEDIDNFKVEEGKGDVQEEGFSQYEDSKVEIGRKDMDQDDDVEDASDGQRNSHREETKNLDRHINGEDEEDEHNAESKDHNSREGDLTQERLHEQDEDDQDKLYPERGQHHEVEKALDLDDDLDADESDDQNDSQNMDQDGIQRTISEREQPLDEVINRNGDIIVAQTKSENGDSKIIRASDDRGSKETSNGVLETPPPDEYDEMDPDLAATEMVKKDKKTKVFYSDKSESSVESMMADTPSNYNIPNGRFDDKNKGLKGLGYGSMLDKYPNGSQKGKNKFRKPNLDIISEIEIPGKAPSQLNNIKHLKTTKNERNFIDSVLGSDKTSFVGDMIPGSMFGKGNESDRGPGSDHNPISQHYDIRRHSKSNLRNNFPSKSLEPSNLEQRLKYNHYMISNNGSENNSAAEGFGNDYKPAFKNQSAYDDKEMIKEIKSSLPPIRYPKFKKKKQGKKKLKLVEDKNLSLTNVNDLESAYLSGKNLL